MNWIKKNKTEFIIVLLIISITALLRLYRIDEYMTFRGDEGRDALVMRKILINYDFPLLGPPTSIGNMYLGPLYYYMIAIPMFIFWLNPVAAAVLVALIGTATVFLIYYLTRVWFGMKSAIIASVLYSFSPVNIIYSHSSWNPNPAPFFSLIIFFGLYKLNQTKNFLWLVLVGGSLAFAVQMHYLALILAPIVVTLVLREIFLTHKKKSQVKNLILGNILGIMIFLFLMSPLLIFDLKHNFMNYKAISTFFGDRQTTVNLNLFNTFGRIIPIYQHNLVERYMALKNPFAGIVVSVLVLVPVILVLFQYIKRKVIYWPLMTVSLWLIIGVLGLAIYKQTIYDHYLGFLNPAPFILFGSLIFILKKFKKRFIEITFFAAAILLLILNIFQSPLKHPPNNQLKRTKDVSKFVIAEARGKPYNFALLSKNNYDDAYEFFLITYNNPPKQVPVDITDQLFVVCEDDECNPINHPKYEIAGFGWSKIESEKNFSGVKVFKLIHNPSGK